MGEGISSDPLEEGREQLDDIDNQILVLLRQRSEIVAVIAQIKKERGLEAYQPDRYNAMLERLQAEADIMDLDKQLVIDIWSAIHAASLRQQSEESIVE